MNTAKVQPEDDVRFLLGSPLQFTRTEAARVPPDQPDAPAHDSFTRLLTRLEPDAEALGLEARPQVRPADGVRVLDDSTLDKPYARTMGLVTWHWSGNHHGVVKGVNLLTLPWTDGDRRVPCDYRIHDKAHDGFGKNDLFVQQLRQAKRRGLSPQCVCFDGRYGGLDNLKGIRSSGRAWLGRLKSNRKARVDFGQAQAIGAVDIPEPGRVVHLPAYGPIRVFRVADGNGDTDHWATGGPGMDALTRLKYADCTWRIEEYHRGIKQFRGVEGCQARRAKARRNHIGLSIRAFLRMGCHCLTLGLSWFQAKPDVIRDAVRSYLANPTMRLPQAA